MATVEGISTLNEFLRKEIVIKEILQSWIRRVIQHGLHGIKERNNSIEFRVIPTRCRLQRCDFGLFEILAGFDTQISRGRNLCLMSDE